MLVIDPGKLNNGLKNSYDHYVTKNKDKCAKSKTQKGITNRSKSGTVFQTMPKRQNVPLGTVFQTMPKRQNVPLGTVFQKMPNRQNVSSGSKLITTNSKTNKSRCVGKSKKYQWNNYTKNNQNKLSRVTSLRRCPINSKILNCESLQNVDLFNENIETIQIEKIEGKILIEFCIKYCND